MRGMRSILGGLAAFCAAALFGLAYYLAVRPGAQWLDGQWVFLAALPYNWATLHLTGASNFSPDAPREIASAALFDVILAFVAGALVEAAARALARWIARLRARA
jgi:hypothetical protein